MLHNQLQKNNSQGCRLCLRETYDFLSLTSRHKSAQEAALSQWVKIVEFHAI